jgi:phosphoribosylglycinamide formyltransferase 1
MTPMPSPARIAVFLSGSGRTLVNLHDAIGRDELDATVALVVASRDCVGAERAREHGLRTIVHNAEFSPDELDALVRAHDIEWIVLAGYLRLLPITPALEGRVVNIHPALLPAFGGPGMHGLRVHRAVLDAGCKVSGCTVHLCDDRYDTGPILAQRACEVRDDDTPETLAARVFELERALYPLTLARLVAGGYELRDGRAVTATS